MFSTKPLSVWFLVHHQLQSRGRAPRLRTGSLSLHLILLKYYLSSPWTPWRRLFEKSSAAPPAWWLIAVFSQPARLKSPPAFHHPPVTHGEGKQSRLTRNHFFFFLFPSEKEKREEEKKNFAHCITHCCAWWVASAVEVSSEFRKWLFFSPLRSVSVGTRGGPLFGVLFWHHQRHRSAAFWRGSRQTGALIISPGTFLFPPMFCSTMLIPYQFAFACFTDL